VTDVDAVHAEALRLWLHGHLSGRDARCYGTVPSLFLHNLPNRPMRRDRWRIIAWLRSGQLLVANAGIGAGLLLTSILTVSSTGGMARLIVGLPDSPRVALKFPLFDATGALLSPDGQRLLVSRRHGMRLTSSLGQDGRNLGVQVHSTCGNLVRALGTHTCHSCGRPSSVCCLDTVFS